MKIRIFDATLWETGHSKVVTVPTHIVEKMNLKKGVRLEVRIMKLED